MLGEEEEEEDQVICAIMGKDFCNEIWKITGLNEKSCLVYYEYF